MIGVFACAVVLSADPGEPKALRDLQGEWVLVREETRGPGYTAHRQDLGHGMLVVRGDQVLCERRFGDEVLRTRYVIRVDDSVLPHRFDAVLRKDLTALGIFEFRDGRLIRYHTQPGDPRPKDFTETPAVICKYSEYERKKDR